MNDAYTIVSVSLAAPLAAVRGKTLVQVYSTLLYTCGLLLIFA